MPFVCPECASDSLEVVGSLELPPDAWWDEISLQVLACANCGFRGAAVYEESRRGALDSEVVNHHGHRVSAASASALLRGIAECPAPRDARCRCAAHVRWGRTDATGRWIGLRESRGTFPLHWA